jgi:hypothetical protein
MRNFAIAAAAVLAASACLADIAPNPLMTGGTNLTVRGEANAVPVTMLWEEVDLTPTPARNTVRAVFLLKNTSAAPAEMEVGFPSYYEMPMQDFAVEIDANKALGELKKDDVVSGPMKKHLFTYWMCWPMKFAPGQERKVTVSYWVKPQSENRTRRQTTANGRPTTVSELVMFAGNLPDDLRDKVGARESGYVLRTGAGWAGTIGKATIRLHYGEGFAKEAVTWMNPAKGWTFDKAGNTDTLVLENLKPKGEDDIAYNWCVGGAEADKRLLMDALKAGKLSVPARKDLLTYLGWNAYALKRPKLTADQLEVLTRMVAPDGPGFDPSQLADFGSWTFYQSAYRDVWHAYRDGNQTAKATGEGQAYGEFLRGLLTVKQAEADKAQREPDKKAIAEQVAGIKKDLAEVEEFLKANPAGAATRP